MRLTLDLCFICTSDLLKPARLPSSLKTQQMRNNAFSEAEENIQTEKRYSKMHCQIRRVNEPKSSVTKCDRISLVNLFNLVTLCGATQV